MRDGPPGPEGLATVTVDARKQSLLGLKTVAVTRAPFETSIRTTGRVAADERRVHHVHTRYEGFVEHVTADFTGKFVKKGEALALIYSPELYATQQEYLLALKASRSLGPSGVPSVAQGGRDLLDAARQRLLLWEITPADIERIEKSGEPIRAMPVYAPISGYVTGRTAYHGMKVMPADTLFDILDLSAVWVLADVYEYELPRLSLGEKATMTLSYWPGRSWDGHGHVHLSVRRREDAHGEGAHRAREPEGRAEARDVRGRDDPRARRGPSSRFPTTRSSRAARGTSSSCPQGEGKLVPREVSVGDHGAGVVEVRAGLKEGEVVVRARTSSSTPSRG